MLLEQERTKVIEIALKIQKEKLISLTFGNFSLRDSGVQGMCASPPVECPMRPFVLF